jgi:uncharacterized membrane protein
MLCILGVIAVWLGGMIPSLMTNIYEDIIKKIASNSTDTQTHQSSNLHIRIHVLIIFSIVYMGSVPLIIPGLIKFIWVKIKRAVEDMDVNQLTYNAVAPLPPRST